MVFTGCYQAHTSKFLVHAVEFLSTCEFIGAKIEFHKQKCPILMRPKPKVAMSLDTMPILPKALGIYVLAEICSLHCIWSPNLNDFRLLNMYIFYFCMILAFSELLKLKKHIDLA